MSKKVSFNEIITKRLTGTWCEGLALIEVYEDEINIQNIYRSNGAQVPINGYDFNTQEAIFSEVYKMTYEEALDELLLNKMTIISPKSTVICFEENGEISVNDGRRFKDFYDILDAGIISKAEITGKWSVFLK